MRCGARRRLRISGRGRVHSCIARRGEAAARGVAGTCERFSFAIIYSGLDPRRAFSYSPAARSEQRATRVAARAEQMRYEADIRAVGSALGSGLRSESCSADHGEVRSAWMPLECSGIAFVRIAGRPIAPGKIGVLRPPGTRLSGSFFARMEASPREISARSYCGRCVPPARRKDFTSREKFLRLPATPTVLNRPRWANPCA